MNIDEMKLVKATYESEDGKYRIIKEHTKDGFETKYLVKFASSYSWQSWTKWCKHREDGPAVIIEKPDGTIVEKYYQRDVLHREDGPASYYERGKNKGKPMYRLKGNKVSAYDVLGDCAEAMFHELQNNEFKGKKKR